MEFVGPYSLEDFNEDDPEGRPRELGFGAELMRRHLITLSPDGAKIVSDTLERS